MAEVTKEGDVTVYAEFDNRDSVRRAALTALPVIDLTPFVSDGSRGDRERVAAEIRRACIDIGFFYLRGHGIAQSELDEAIRWGHRFFELPLEERMKVHKDLSPLGVGYVPAGGNDRNPDTREVFSIAREALPGEADPARNRAGESLWPADLVLPGFRAFMTSHLEKRVALTRQLLHAFAMSLELPETFFDASHRYMVGSLVYNYYPPLDPSKIERTQWGISPHTDYGSFTVLSQDSLGGLEVRNAAGDWVEVPPLEGAFVINIGDLFARWTNDLYVSTLHRAVNYNRGARISCPYFVIPESDVVIDCLETCRGAGSPPRYEPVRAGEYVRALLDQSRRTGRAGVSVQAASRFRTKGGDAPQ
jgi:isopenicillin N synthase-like dioxygenase